MQGAVFLFNAQNLQHGFKRDRFEIQTVRGVVIGGNCLWVTVDHDGFIARRCKGIAGVHATIVKFNALSNAVGAAAEDDDFLGVGGACFAFHVAHRGGLVGGIHVGGLRLKFCCTGINALENGFHAKAQAGAAHLGFVAAC